MNDLARKIEDAISLLSDSTSLKGESLQEQVDSGIAVNNAMANLVFVVEELKKKDGGKNE